MKTLGVFCAGVLAALAAAYFAIVAAFGEWM